jgi:hypothetical protein
MAVTKRTRFEVLRRDGNRCRYCGASTDDGARLTIDHVTPVALGGSDDPGNLVAACVDCNAGKTSSAPDAQVVAQVSDDAIRWARAIAQAAAESQEADADRRRKEDEFKARWQVWTYNDGTTVELHPGWRQSLTAFLNAGLTAADIEDLIAVAMTTQAKDPWRYFCGCAWTRIRKLQDRAQEIVSGATEHSRRPAFTCECPTGDTAHESTRDCDLAEEGYAQGWVVGYDAAEVHLRRRMAAERPVLDDPVLAFADLLQHAQAV